MNIPDKIKIGWQEYEVVEKEPDTSLTSGGSLCYGQIFYGEGKIYINNSYDTEMKKATLVHELIHGIDELFKIGLEEKQVEVLGNGLYAVIKDNPNLFKGEK